MPLVSGHEGGANQFARQVAACLGATPVVTTASESTSAASMCWLGRIVRLDCRAGASNTSPLPWPWSIVRPVIVVQEIGHRGTAGSSKNRCRTMCGRASRRMTSPRMAIASFGSPIGRSASWGRFAADRVFDYRPKSLVVGVGCERGISAEALEDGLRRVFDEFGWSLACVQHACFARRQGRRAGAAGAGRAAWLADRSSIQPRNFRRCRGVVNPSAVVEACVGTPAVAEAAALLAARTENLLVEKQIVASPLATQQDDRWRLPASARFEARGQTHGPRDVCQCRAWRSRPADTQGPSLARPGRCRDLRRLAGSRRGGAPGPADGSAVTIRHR